MTAREFGKNLSLFLAALVVAVLAAEAAVRILLPQNLSGSWRVESENGLLLNKSYGSAQHEFGSRLVRYRFGEPHLRVVTRTRPEHARRILVLGDSFTFGWLLNDAATYVARLQELMDAEFGAGRFVLLNAAAGGWGAADYLFFLEDFGPEIRPDAVLVFVNTDDIGRSLASPLLRVKRDAQGYLVERVAFPRSRLKQWLNSEPTYSTYQWILEHSHLIQLIRQAGLEFFSVGTAGLPERSAIGPRSIPRVTGADPVAVGQALFRRMHDWSRVHHAELWVTTTGFHNLVADGSPISEPTAAFMASASKTFSDLRVPYHDITPIIGETIRAAPEQYVIADDGHPNERAAQLIAYAVFYGFLRERLLALR